MPDHLLPGLLTSSLVRPSPSGRRHHEMTEPADRFQDCYKKWLSQQREDLEELRGSLAGGAQDETRLGRVVSKSLQHFKEYGERRLQLCREDAPALFCPAFCSPFENSFLWIAGCRPTVLIRLMYTLSGSELAAHLDEFLRGVRRGNLAELTAAQLGRVNELHVKTVREEDKLSARMASLQEELGDEPLVTMAMEAEGPTEAQVDEVMEHHAAALAKMIEDADKLRLSTLTDLVGILTPLQAVDLLIAGKQLHLSFKEWGQRRSRRHGEGDNA